MSWKSVVQVKSSKLVMISLFTFKESVLGISPDALKFQNSEYARAIQKYVKYVCITFACFSWNEQCYPFRVTYIAYQRITKLSLRSSFIFKRTKLYQEEKHALHVIHSFVDNVIVTRRQELIDQSTNDRKNRALLDILLQTKIDGNLLSDKDIRDETSNFILAVIRCINFYFPHFSSWKNVLKPLIASGFQFTQRWNCTMFVSHRKISRGSEKMLQRNDRSVRNGQKSTTNDSTVKTTGLLGSGCERNDATVQYSADNFSLRYWRLQIEWV